jgi:AmmeMemoRadiSam system protein A
MSDLGAALLALARAAIEGRDVDFPLPELDAPGATFVTLTRDGRLRGCIGSLEARRPLREDVAYNARAAAFRDPRFKPLRRDEFGDVRIEVSLLTEPVEVPVSSEEDAVASLQPGSGYVLEWAGRKGTFLPQVWEQLPEADAFWSRLRVKAGFPEGFWSPEVRLKRYEVRSWSE